MNIEMNDENMFSCFVKILVKVEDFVWQQNDMTQ